MNAAIYRDNVKFTYTGAGSSQSYTTLSAGSEDTKDTMYQNSPLKINIRDDYKQYFNTAPSFQKRYDSVRIIPPAKMAVSITAASQKESDSSNGKKENYNGKPMTIGDYSTMRGYKLH